MRARFTLKQIIFSALDIVDDIYVYVDSDVVVDDAASLC